MQPAAEPGPVARSTTPVTVGSMIAETNVPGSVQYADRETIASKLAGVVTELPEVGSVIEPGGVLYRVDTRPVFLLDGVMPVWRNFAQGMTEGEDIRQLEENLATLGFFGGEPDTRFDWDTTQAILNWQASLGLERTGTLDRSTLVFSGRNVRVDTLETRIGAEIAPGGPVYQVTDSSQIIDLTIRSSDRSLAAPGNKVTVALPDGGTTEGVIESVSQPINKPDADDGTTSVVIPVRVSVADQGVLAPLTLANVTVRFASILSENVLTVPVEALVPISDTAFAVELPELNPDGERELLPVTTGAFSSGMVEVSGTGVSEGVDVVVPSL
jgi:peptidoglycan hydrolase-like protein with peptidoglycan-binding domain